MSIFSGAIKGAADVAVPALLEGWKADIMAARDVALQKVRQQEHKTEREFRTSERVAGETYKTTERVAGEEAKAGEGVLERESRERIAKTRSTGAGATPYKVVGGQLFNTATGKTVPLPENTTKLKELAVKIAAANLEAQEFADKPKSMDVLTSEAFTMLGKLGDKPKDKGGKEVVFTHPTKGDVYEEDIQLTMKTHGLTRAKVMEKLGQ